MGEKLTKESADKLMKIKGEARGITLKTDWDAVLHEQGEAGLRRLEAKMAELGYPLKYQEIRTMDFYPIGMDVLSMLAIKEVFSFDDKKIERMGASAVRFSLFLKVFLKYFISFESFVIETPKMWRKHYTVGEPSPEFHEKERYVILKVKNFKIHPIYCIVLKGYFTKILEMLVNSSVTCQETKCPFKGSQYYEFLLKWGKR